MRSLPLSLPLSSPLPLSRLFAIFTHRASALRVQRSQPLRTRAPLENGY